MRVAGTGIAQRNWLSLYGRASDTTGRYNSCRNRTNGLTLDCSIINSLI